MDIKNLISLCIIFRLEGGGRGVSGRSVFERRRNEFRDRRELARVLFEHGRDRRGVQGLAGRQRGHRVYQRGQRSVARHDGLVVARADGRDRLGVVLRRGRKAAAEGGKRARDGVDRVAVRRNLRLEAGDGGFERCGAFRVFVSNVGRGVEADEGRSDREEADCTGDEL